MEEACATLFPISFSEGDVFYAYQSQFGQPPRGHMGYPMSLIENIQDQIQTQDPSLTSETSNSLLHNSIIELILNRRLRPGDALPNERELVEELGVGRNSVREAIKSLQALGVVTIKRGSGTYVSAGSLDPLVNLLSYLARISLHTDGRAALELVQVRAALEVELVARAVAQTRPDDLARLEALVIIMETRAGLGQSFTDIDMAFHAALYAPLGHGLLSELLRSFWLAYSSIAETIPDRGVDLATTAADHRLIFDLVAKGDGAGAAVAVRNHFNGIRAHIDKLGWPHVNLDSGPVTWDVMGPNLSIPGEFA